MTDLAIADVLDVEYPGSPSWADDGRSLAATIYEDDGPALLVADFADDERDVPTTARYRPGDGSVAAFDWRPASRELAVTTDEGEAFLLDATTGTARLLVAEPDGVSHPTWGPRGDRLAYYRGGRATVRSVADGTGTERTLDLPPNDRFLPRDRMLAWNDDGDRLAVKFVDTDTTQVGVVDVDADSGALDWRTTGAAATAPAGWLADGRLLVDRRRDAGTVREVVAIDVATGGSSVLLEEVDRERGTVSAGPPEISPDGTRVALALPHDGWEHLHVVDTGDGTGRQLTAGEFEDKGLNRASPQWVDDGRLVFASNRTDLGQRQLFVVDVDDGTVSPAVDSAGTNVHPAPAPDDTRVAYVHADRSRSPELRVAPIDGEAVDAADEATATNGPELTDAVRVTESAVDDWPVDPIPPKPVSFESHDGTEIHGYLLDPRGHGVDPAASELPALVWVHGGPMRQMRDGWHPSRSYGLAYTAHQYFARQGYVGLLVNYRGGIGYGRAFRQALAENYGRDEMGDVAAGADFLRRHDAVDPDAVGVWGLSYGGYATLQLLGTHPTAFDLGVSIAGLADLQDYERWATETKYPRAVSSQAVVFGGDPWSAPDEWAVASPVTHMDDYEAPLYSFHGTGDRYVNVGQQDAVVDELLEREATFEAEYYPDESHVFARRSVWRRTLRKIEAALDRHL